MTVHGLTEWKPERTWPHRPLLVGCPDTFDTGRGGTGWSGVGSFWDWLGSRLGFTQESAPEEDAQGMKLLPTFPGVLVAAVAQPLACDVCKSLVWPS